MQKAWKLMVVGLILVLGVVLSGCGDDGGAADDGDDDGITIGTPNDDDTPDDDGNNDDNDNDDNSSGASNSGDLQVVWPLPDGEFMVWLPYQLIDDSFQYAESASFETSTVAEDTILAFYRDYFPTIGLLTDEFPAGDSTAMNLTNPDKPQWSGVVQVGADVNGKVIVSQGYTDLLEQGTTTTAPDAEAVSEDSGLSSDG